MDKVINVCLACDNNYAKHAGVVVASALSSSDQNDKLHFYILDGGISETRKSEINSLKSIKDCEINFISVNRELFSEYANITTHLYVTIETYYRLKLASLLPNVDRIIYFDCDFVINTSLRDLFNTEMGENLIAGVRDINKRMVKKNPTYINAGMIVFNLEQMRKDRTEDKFLTWTKENAETIAIGDQTIINEVCKGRIKIVNDEWNVQSSNFINRSSYTHNPKAIHFVSIPKPWDFGSYSYHRDFYFKYLQLTPWKLNEKDYIWWTKYNQIASLFVYFKHRPLFLFRPKFYKAFLHTYILKDKSQKNIKILVAYHKKAQIYDNKMLVPIHCGRALACKASKDGVLQQEEFDWLIKNTIGDDTGENISHLNRQCNEMTAIYWAWKNYDKLGNPDYIGLNHYRRYFDICYSKIPDILDKYTFIKQAHKKYKKTLTQLWYKNGTMEFLQQAFETCKKVSSRGQDIEDFFNSGIRKGFCNMFIFPKSIFFNYCEFIFPILFALPQDEDQGRSIGYFAELLTSYFMYNLAKTHKAYNTSFIDYMEDNSLKYYANKIFCIKHENYGQKHTVVNILGLRFKIKHK